MPRCTVGGLSVDDVLKAHEHFDEGEYEDAPQDVFLPELFVHF